MAFHGKDAMAVTPPGVRYARTRRRCQARDEARGNLSGCVRCP